jgi:hypothetical protein
MNIWINIFFKSTYLKATLFGLTEWPFMWLGIPIVMIDGFQYLPLGFSAFVILYLLAIIEFIDDQFAILFTWVIIIRLVNTVRNVPTTPLIVISIPELLFKFLPTKTPFDPWPKFATNLINIPPLTTFVLGATIVSTPMVVMTTLND